MLVVIASIGGWGVTGIATASAASDLAIGAAAGSDFVVGTDSAFVLTVTNVGPSATSGTVTVTNTLPSTMTYDSVFASGWACAGAATVTCTTTATTAAGASLPEIAIYAVPTAAAVPSATNHATVSIAGDPVSANNVSDLTTKVVYGADMSISAGHVGSALKSGQDETINIKVHNDGYYRVDGTTTVTSAVPASLQVVSVAGGTTWNCTAAQTFSCTTSSNGGSTGNYLAIKLVVKATDAAYPSALVTATVTNAGDQNPANNAATDTIQVQAAHDVAVEVVAPPAMAVGTIAQLAFRARNAGTSAAAGATVTFALPPQVRFLGAVTAGWTCAPSPQASCTDARPISAFNLLTIRVKALRPIAGVPMTVTATTAGDQNPANDTTMAPVTITPYVPRSYSITGIRGQHRTAVLNVGDKLAVRFTQPRRGPKWRVRTASTAVNRPFVKRSRGFIQMRFTAKHAGRATLRFKRKAARGKKARKYTLVVTVVNPGA